MATIAVRACLNYKYESRVMQPTDWRRHFVVRPRPSREPSVVVLPPVLTLGVTPIMDRTGGVMKAPRSARPVGADHSLQRAARFRFPKTGIVPAVLILCGGIWWWLSRTPGSVYLRTPGMREPCYRRACNPPVIRRGSRAWPIAGDNNPWTKPLSRQNPLVAFAPTERETSGRKGV